MHTQNSARTLLETAATPITTYKSTLEVADSYAVGTVRELVAAGITVNGVVADKAMLSVLIALGFADCVGVAEKMHGASGIAPKIYRFDFEQHGEFRTLPVDLSV